MKNVDNPGNIAVLVTINKYIIVKKLEFYDGTKRGRS